MSEILTVSKINEVYIKVDCESGIGFELNQFFTFEVPGARFTPMYRNKMWDGKIRLYNTLNKTLYRGLLTYLEEFAKERDYEIEYQSDFSSDEFSLHEAHEFIKTLNLPFQPRDYQIEAFVHSIREKRGLLLSPTASGKSFIIYLITRYLESKTLIIVPTTSLVHQMTDDFKTYGYKKDIHMITAGVDKQSSEDVIISTWQSIYKMPKAWFDQFEVIIGDEAHLFKAKSLTSILSKMTRCEYRFGFTGTLDGTQTHKLVLEGLFGPVRKVTTTKDLIDKRHLADFKIKILVLKYPEALRKQNKGLSYQDEMDFLVKHEPRNKFIKNLIISLNGNTLMLFQYVDKHGRVLEDMIKEAVKNSVTPDRKVFFVYGGVDAEEREEVRRITEQETDAIIVASFGTFSTGINIKNLHNVVFASPSKSRVRNLQSIGRGLRKGDNKSSAILYDIADDLSIGSYKNHTLNHFVERMKIYGDEKFEYKIYTVKLK